MFRQLPAGGSQILSWCHSLHSQQYSLWIALKSECKVENVTPKRGTFFMDLPLTLWKFGINCSLWVRSAFMRPIGCSSLMIHPPFKPQLLLKQTSFKAICPNNQTDLFTQNATQNFRTSRNEWRKLREICSGMARTGKKAARLKFFLIFAV